MKIYIGYMNWGYDGCSSPCISTTSKEKIKQWVKESPDIAIGENPRRYIELELEGADK